MEDVDFIGRMIERVTKEQVKTNKLLSKLIKLSENGRKE